jgi:recombination protein RecT
MEKSMNETKTNGTTAAPTGVAPASAQGTELDKKEKSDGERFAALMIKEFAVCGVPDVSDRERMLINGYFMGISLQLQKAESDRIRKNEWAAKKGNETNELAFAWKNVDMTAIARHLVPYARMGIDMTIKNHLSAVPFKNGDKTKYIMTFIDGYTGMEYIAKKYSRDEIINVSTELVYTTDKFEIIKKDRDNAIETYVFQITNPTDRGEIIGAFSYIEYKDSAKNKLVFMTRRHMEKRKPKHAAAEFWGGKAQEWVWDSEVKKRVQKDVEVDGWFEEMCLKTIKRETYKENKHILIDPEKIDANYQAWKETEIRMAEYEVVAEIADNANTEMFDAPPPPAPQVEARAEKNASADTATPTVAVQDNDDVSSGDLFGGEPPVDF